MKGETVNHGKCWNNLHIHCNALWVPTLIQASCICERRKIMPVDKCHRYCGESELKSMGKMWVLQVTKYLKHIHTTLSSASLLTFTTHLIHPTIFHISFFYIISQSTSPQCWILPKNTLWDMKLMKSARRKFPLPRKHIRTKQSILVQKVRLCSFITIKRRSLQCSYLTDTSQAKSALKCNQSDSQWMEGQNKASKMSQDSLAVQVAIHGLFP